MEIFFLIPGNNNSLAEGSLSNKLFNFEGNVK